MNVCVAVCPYGGHSPRDTVFIFSFHAFTKVIVKHCSIHLQNNKTFNVIHLYWSSAKSQQNESQGALQYKVYRI